MKKLSDYSGLIEKKIRDISLPGDDLESLYGPVSYSMSAGGKRLRPSLLMMSAEAFGGEEAAERAESAAIGIELFHNFTLLHDDVMDNSALRRGRASVHAKWDINTAILSGDTMLTLATRYVSKVDKEILPAVLDAFNDMALRVYEGQRLDMDFESRTDVNLEAYIRMIRLKTGALLGASAKIGALIGGASVEDADRMFEFGMMLGVAFQIQDDWLDVYGDASTFGKPIGGDINNNKKSFLLLKAYDKNNADSAALSDAMKLPAGEAKIKIVTRLYDRMGMSAACREEIAAYSAKAVSSIKGVKISDAAREPFRLMVDKLTGRKK